ncbi:MAG: hypothetical protein IJ087_09290 [Eggerthellaceae bacterium]|nr:hypothetical protein [Eggerthellaceae bacterium]
MPTMTDEKIAKQRFVQEELAAMLRAATGGFVHSCEYDGSFNGYEIVYVATHPDPWAIDFFAVDVTGDSHWEIAKDVMKTVAERYE